MEVLCGVNPMMLFNMDETMINTRKKLKVLVNSQNGVKPLVVKPDVFPHITAAVTICASGKYFDPFLLLANKHTNTGLEMFDGKCYIGSTLSGWMTKVSFACYALIFVMQLSLYRLTLPSYLAEESVLLVVDGHSSRLNFEACLLLYYFNVDLLILPGHTSHVMQPFDVSIGSPLKSSLKECLTRKQFNIDNDDLHDLIKLKKKTSAELRVMLIESFLDALSKSGTPGNIIGSFKKCGLSPLDPEMPLASAYTMRGQPDIYNIPNGPISSMFLTSEASLSYLFQQQYNRALTPEDMTFDIHHYINCFSSNEMEDFWLLSKLPPLLVYNNDGTFGKL